MIWSHLLASPSENQQISAEAVTRIAASYPDFIAGTPEISGRGMRGMRHHLVHGYFRIDCQVVEDTVHNALPSLLSGIVRPRASLPADGR